MLVCIILICFLNISIITNIIGSIIPDFIKDFKISLALVSLLPFSLFIAYGVVSIPTGMLLEKVRAKKILYFSLCFMLFGCLLLVSFPSYKIAIISLFILGVGMASMQVIINPLLRVSGGEENYAFFSILAQLVFGIGSFIAPWIYKYFLTQKNITQNPNYFIKWVLSFSTNSYTWVSIYIVFIILICINFIIFFFTKFPNLNLKADEKVENVKTHVSLLKNKMVIIYFIAMFLYIGTEQTISDWVSQYFYVYFNKNPQIVGVKIVSFFWGSMTLGGIIGLVLVKYVESKKVLILFTSIAIITLAFALGNNEKIAAFCFPMMGFFLSVMFPIILSLALNSVSEHHGSFTGILITGIIGGAIVPMIVGKLGDLFGLKIALCLIFVNLIYILFIGIYAKPLIHNKIIKLNKKS